MSESIEQIYVVPVAGRRVRDPKTLKLLPGEGKKVPKDKYWMTRLQKGDVVQQHEPKAKAPEAKAPEAKASEVSADKPVKSSKKK